MDYECFGCGTIFKRYSTIQRLCGTCSRAKVSRSRPKPRTPLKRSQKPIRQRGKAAKQWETFRDKVARPYLDKKFGRVCSVEGCGVTENLDVDHVKTRGAHPELRYDVTNLRYLCRPHHVQVTGVPQWTKKAAA